MDSDILETILLQKIMNEHGHFWILGLGSFRNIGNFDSQVQSYTVVLTNNSGTSIVQIPILYNVKIEPNKNTALFLSDLDDDVCPDVDTLSFSFRKTRTLIPLRLLRIDIDNTPCSLLFMKLPPHGSPSHPPLHPSSSSLCLNIVDALKLTKSRRRSKLDNTKIDFDNIDVRDVKYLPSSFDDDVLYCPHCLWVFLVLKVVLWMTWIRCMTAILGAQLKSQISKVILDFLGLKSQISKGFLGLSEWLGFWHLHFT